jgi:hypothetical protein
MVANDRQHPRNDRRTYFENKAFVEGGKEHDEDALLSFS